MKVAWRCEYWPLACGRYNSADDDYCPRCHSPAPFTSESNDELLRRIHNESLFRKQENESAARQFEK